MFKRRNTPDRSIEFADEEKTAKIARDAAINRKILVVQFGVALVTLLIFAFPFLLRSDGETMYFVLEISPEEVDKMSIQEALGTTRIKKLLAEDNYKYIGRYLSFEPVNDASILSTDQTKELMSANSRKQVKALRQKGNHLLASNQYIEALHPNHVHGWKTLFDALASGGRRGLKKQNWKLVVAISYQRLHVWEPARWTHIYSRKREPTTGKILLSNHQDWPGFNGDYAIPGFQEHFDQIYRSSSDDGNNDSSAAPKHPAKVAYEAWKDVADEIVLINLHENDNRKETYRNEEKVLCRALPGSQTACSSIWDERNKKKATHIVQPSECLDCDLLAVHARETKIIDGSIENRQWVVKKIFQGLKMKRTKFPMNCLSQTALEEFRTWSLDVEQWLAATSKRLGQKGGNVHGGGEQIDADPVNWQQDFQSSWEKSVADQRFCSVDVVKALEVTYWNRHIANLNRMYPAEVLRVQGMEVKTEWQNKLADAKAGAKEANN